jgi:hypothetical protein
VANPTTNYGFVMPTPTDLVTDLPADFGVFGQAVDTQMKTNSDAATQKATLTTKGDIYAATGTSTPARLAVGANDTVLTADSSTATGLKWATASSGGMTVIASGSFSGSSIVLSSIPATYKNLQLAIRNYKPATDGANLSIRFNGDSTANRYEYGTVNVSTDDAFERTEMQIQAAQDNTTSNSLIKIDVFDYTNAVTWKIIDNFAFVTNPSVSTQFDFARSWGVYNQTSAISSITLFPSSGNFTSGNYILYGVS